MAGTDTLKYSFLTLTVQLSDPFNRFRIRSQVNDLIYSLPACLQNSLGYTGSVCQFISFKQEAVYSRENAKSEVEMKS